MNWSNSNTYTIKASKIGAYLSGIIFSYSPIFSFWSRIHCFLLSSLRRSSPGSLGGKESTCNVGDPGSIPGLGKIPWRRKGQPSPVFLPVKSYGQRSMVGYSPWSLLDTASGLHLDKFVQPTKHAHTFPASSLCSHNPRTSSGQGCIHWILSH